MKKITILLLTICFFTVSCKKECTSSSSDTKIVATVKLDGVVYPNVGVDVENRHFSYDSDKNTNSSGIAEFTQLKAGNYQVSVYIEIGENSYSDEESFYLADKETKNVTLDLD